LSANPEAAKDETIVLRDAFVPHGRTVPFENGWAWIAVAWPIFRRAIGLWIGIALTLLIIFLALPNFSFIFAVASVIVAPVFTAGLMIVSRTLDQGGEPQYKQLFAGFKNRFGSLLGVGVLCCVATAAIALIIGVVTGASVYGLVHATSVEAVLALGATLLLAALLFFALSLPIAMAIWFAPALIVFHEAGTVEAMKGSFLGCLRNTMPFLLYGIVLLIPAIIATIPFALGWLVLAPVTVASIYTSYRDIYFTS